MLDAFVSTKNERHSLPASHRICSCAESVLLLNWVTLILQCFIRGQHCTDCRCRVLCAVLLLSSHLSIDRGSSLLSLSLSLTLFICMKCMYMCVFVLCSHRILPTILGFFGQQRRRRHSQQYLAIQPCAASLHCPLKCLWVLYPFTIDSSSLSSIIICTYCSHSLYVSVLVIRPNGNCFHQCLTHRHTMSADTETGQMLLQHY